MGKQKTTEQIVLELEVIYGDRFSYGKSSYTKNKIPMLITCVKHQIDFEKRPDVLLRGGVVGCPKCKGEWRMPLLKTNEEYLADLCASRVDILSKYDLSDIQYDGYKSKIKVFCLSHNKYFYPSAGDFLTKKTECPDCSYESRGEELRSSTEKFIKESSKVHNNKYGYDRTVYTLSGNSVEIFCPVEDHGYFTQVARDHLHSKAGCPLCYKGKFHKWYKHGNSIKDQSDRNCTEYNKWRRTIKNKSTHCDCCGILFDKDVNSQIHHLNSFSYYPDQRFDINNGVALCEVCHDDYHSFAEDHVATKYDYEHFKGSRGL